MNIQNEYTELINHNYATTHSFRLDTFICASISALFHFSVLLVGLYLLNSIMLSIEELFILILIPSLAEIRCLVPLFV